MDVNRVAIATMTWARDAQEEQLLYGSLSNLAALGLPVFVTDAGSGPAFVEFLRGFANFHVFEAQTPGLWPQIGRSLQAAHQTACKFIFYTESDKRDFLHQSAHQFIAQARESDDVGIVLAARSQESFLTFPAFQRNTETAINHCCSEIVGQNADYCYGPFLMNTRIVPFLNAQPATIGWGWRPFAFGMAHRLGYDTRQITMNLPCPPEQRDDNAAERIYRMKQLNQSIEGLLLSTTTALAQG